MAKTTRANLMRGTERRLSDDDLKFIIDPLPTDVSDSAPRIQQCKAVQLFRGV